ncbi:ATP-binding protein [Labilibaculum sp. DW002]|jgi:anti-sigma regulatory factor (Ser/Thr protein kinase)|uniref:ATP-binding protein n=1 Tax=Paralabilibaculum antarcticum TaxID=2912572 RepID=A0ABT5VWU3_9BACT|nr:MULTISPECIES: ATP-binding protein [unclassified Labilibaculum]MBI9056663.1 ATP-binding protein [Labilibaculum sp.]MDE5419889.1 ATP-binding protein [Labilibaculum sp. DW002]
MTKSEKLLIFPSELENITRVEKLIDDISSSHNLSAEIYGKISVAIIEAVNNAILHGNQLDISKKVKIEYDIDDEAISFLIEDEGKGFDFASIPDPTLPENLEKTHGRGIFLMNHLADDIEFNENGALVEMKFRLV